MASDALFTSDAVGCRLALSMTVIVSLGFRVTRNGLRPDRAYDLGEADLVRRAVSRTRKGGARSAARADAGAGIRGAVRRTERIGRGRGIRIARHGRCRLGGILRAVHAADR